VIAAATDQRLAEPAAGADGGRDARSPASLPSRRPLAALLAVSIALRIWEDFVAGRIEASTWIHAECDPDGRVMIRYPAPPIGVGCRLCQELAQGENGLIRAFSLE
jgi:hypothetical protein